jgi:hypothetical protein
MVDDFVEYGDGVMDGVVQEPYWKLVGAHGRAPTFYDHHNVFDSAREAG